MDLRHLQAFVEVVRQSSFSKASKALSLTQSTVSKSVKQLEDETGMLLLDRLGQGHRLTAAGELVYQAALKMLLGRSELAVGLDELRGIKRGKLALGLPPIGSSTLFAPLLAVYLRRYPGIEVSLVEHGGQRLLEILASGEIELAATLLPLPHEFESLSVRDDPLVAVLPAAHPLAQRKSIRFVELKDSPFILFEAGFGLNRVILAACDRCRFTPTVAARSSQVDFVIELAAAGLGVAFLPKMIVDGRPLNTTRYVAIKNPSIDWRMAMVWRRGIHLSHAAQAWLTLVREKNASSTDSR